jgi:serine/threonine protein kinase
MSWLPGICCCDTSSLGANSSNVGEYTSIDRQLAPSAQEQEERVEPSAATHQRQFAELAGSLHPEGNLAFEEIYALEAVVAAGAFGSHKTTWIANRIKPISTADNIVAVKEYKNVSADNAASIIREVQLLKDMHHQSIVRCIDFFSNSAEPSTKHLVMEFVEGGRLYDSIVAHGHYDEETARRTVANLADVLCYLSQQRVIFRDLKPENILLVRKDDLSTIKLCGFSFAAKLEVGQVTTHGKWYTAGYSAPEILRSQRYSVEVDVFSFGVVAYILLTGCIPWSEETWEDDDALNAAVLAGEAKFYAEDWEPLSFNARHFVERALANDRNERPTIEEMKEHPWLQPAIHWFGNPWVSRAAWAVKKNTSRLVNRSRQAYPAPQNISYDRNDENRPLMGPA